MDKLTFINGKEFGTTNGAFISMKALITIHGEQHVECYENNNRYKISELTETLDTLHFSLHPFMPCK